MRVAATALGLFVAAAALAGCSTSTRGQSPATAGTGGSSGGVVSTVTPSLGHGASSLLSEALEAWADFPVKASPRPLVLTPPFGLRVQEPDFPTADIKEYDNLNTAYEQGSIQPPPRLPDAPKTSDNYPILTGVQALQVLRTPSNTGAMLPVPPLQVTSIALGMSDFVTDRGRLLLPAWLFSFRDVANPAAVLAVAPPALYLHPPSDFQANGVTRAMSAEVSSSRNTITADFWGAPAGSGPCDANYSLEIATSATAVALEVIQAPQPSGSFNNTPTVACTADATSRKATATLRNGIGNRVVVDAATRNPLAVTTTP
jgi:hypothetical protein